MAEETKQRLTELVFPNLPDTVYTIPQAYEDLESKPNISENEDKAFIIKDNSDNIVAKFDKDGLQTTIVNAQTIKVNNVDIQDLIANTPGSGGGAENVEYAETAGKLKDAIKIKVNGNVEVKSDSSNENVLYDETDKRYYINFDGSKDIDIPLRASISHPQADWETTDRSWDSFIKNKPFGPITDSFHGVVTLKKNVEWETEFNEVIYQPYATADSTSLPLTWPIELNREYNIIFSVDDNIKQQYTVIAKKLTETEYILGNAALYKQAMDMVWPGFSDSFLTTEDTGEPFYFAGSFNSENYIANQTIFPKLIEDIAPDQVNTNNIIMTLRIQPVSYKKLLDTEWLSEDVATKQYVQQEISKIQISGGGNSGGSSSNVIFPETEVEFNYDNPDDPSNTIMGNLAAAALIKAGEKYTVYFDGIPYQLTGEVLPIEIEGENIKGAFLGNSSIISGDESMSTNEPFIIVSLSFYENGALVDGYTVAQTADTEPTPHTIAIYQEVDGISWNDILDKPFGGDKLNVSIDFSTLDTSITADFADPDSEGNIEWVPYLIKAYDPLTAQQIENCTCSLYTKSNELVAYGPIYSDSIHEYDKGIVVLVQALGQVIPIMIAFEAGEHTITLSEEEIMTLRFPEVGCYVPYMLIEFGRLEMTNDTLKYLDNKYLSFMELFSGDIVGEALPTMSFETELNSMLGCFFYDLDQAVVEDFDAWQTNTNNVIVEYDGVTYNCAPIQVDIYDPPLTCVGNVGALAAALGMEGYPITDEPFVFTIMTDDGVFYSKVMFSVTDTEPTQHTMSVSYQGSDTYKVNPDYLPQMEVPDNINVNEIISNKIIVNGIDVEAALSNSGSSGITGIVPIAQGGTGNSLGYIQTGKKSGTTPHAQATAEGKNTTATGAYSHAEGNNTVASGEAAHAENYNTKASGEQSHAEGRSTVASGKEAHAEGTNRASDNDNMPNKTASDGTTIIGPVAAGIGSHAEGVQTYAKGYAAHAEGHRTEALGMESHSEGLSTLAQGEASHAEGYLTKALGDESHAEGWGSEARGKYSHAAGYNTIAKGYASSAYGYKTQAYLLQNVFGKYNTPQTFSDNDAISGSSQAESQSGGLTLFAIGYGVDGTPGDAFSVKANGQVGTAGAINTSGADFAECFEWLDGNQDNQDRRGLFVALEGEKIRLAHLGDDYIGIITGTQAFVGNAAELEWQDKYLTDIFGTRLTQEVTIPERVDTRTGEIIPATTVIQYVVNPNYDVSKPYIPRAERKEWGIVGLTGQVVVVDDGSCVVGGYAAPFVDGIATASDKGYRVMKRLDANHIKVLVK